MAKRPEKVDSFEKQMIEARANDELAMLDVHSEMERQRSLALMKSRKPK